MNNVPIPRYDLLEDYNLKNVKTLDILTTKGCPNKCVFCNENSIWGDFRRKIPQNIYNEIEYYINKYGIYNFEIVDNAFNLSNGFRKALDLLYNSNIEIKWGGNCEISHINEKQILKYIERGLSHCFFGLESASPKILNLMGKKIDLDKFLKLLSHLMTADVRAYLYIMVGFPNETEEDFEKTINFLKINVKYIENIIVSAFTLMKSSPIFNSNLIKPIALSPPELNAWTYETFDGVSHKDRMKRFLLIKKMWKHINP
ncbi:MAG: radical SAM protein [Candidatus Helarchaeota archaeon]|nr:radical SAM protein [Candidatus Helarchaeota archaeon]